MSRGRARIVVRLNDDEMKMAQAAADVIQVDIKHLARMGVLREVQDIRNKLIAKIQKEKETREKVTATEDVSTDVSGGQSPGLSSGALDNGSQGSDDTGTQP